MRFYYCKAYLAIPYRKLRLYKLTSDLIIQLSGEIGCQLVKAPMAAATLYQSIHDLTPPTQPMNTCKQARHRGLPPLLFWNSVVGSLTLFRPGETLTVDNFFNIKVKAAKLLDFT